MLSHCVYCLELASLSALGLHRDALTRSLEVFSLNILAINRPTGLVLCCVRSYFLVYRLSDGELTRLRSTLEPRIQLDIDILARWPLLLGPLLLHRVLARNMGLCGLLLATLKKPISD